eukprot:Ihof_evm5s344 gene=Ihof_evmTU5s344
MIRYKILASQLTSGTYKLSHIAIINNALGILSHNPTYRIPIASCMGLHNPSWTEVVQHFKKYELLFKMPGRLYTQADVPQYSNHYSPPLPKRGDSNPQHDGRRPSNRPTKTCSYHQQQPVNHTTAECSLNPNSHNFGKSTLNKRTTKDKLLPTADQKPPRQIHLSSTTPGTKTSTNLASISVGTVTPTTTLQPDHFIIDTGASMHICPVLRSFSDVQPAHMPICMADGTQLSATLKGTISLLTNTGNTVVLDNVLYLPQAPVGLLSLSALADTSIFSVVPQKSIQIHKDNYIFLTATTLPDHQLYLLDATLQNTPADRVEYNLLNLHPTELLGATSLHTLTDSLTHFHKPIPHTKDFTCDSCAESKILRQSFPSRTARSTRVGERIYSDVIGPVKADRHGHRYIVSFTDDFTHYVTIFLMKTKSEVPQHFKTLLQTFNNLHSPTRLSLLFTDQGREYLSTKFQSFLKSQGIQHMMTLPYAAQSNGLSERMGRQLITMARTAMVDANIPHTLWGYAIAAAAYVHNMT